MRPLLQGAAVSSREWVKEQEGQLVGGLGGGGYLLHAGKLDTPLHKEGHMPHHLVMSKHKETDCQVQGPPICER